MVDIKSIAETADIIVNGYAFTKNKSGYRVLNLNHPESAAVMTETGEILETSMDDIELRIISEYLQANIFFMED
jgi:hypothetical protein